MTRLKQNEETTIMKDENDINNEKRDDKVNQFYFFLFRYLCSDVHECVLVMP